MDQLGRLRRLSNFKNLTFPALPSCRSTHFYNSTAFKHERSRDPHIILALSALNLFLSKFNGSHQEVHFRVHPTDFDRLRPASLLA